MKVHFLFLAAILIFSGEAFCQKKLSRDEVFLYKRKAKDAGLAMKVKVMDYTIDSCSNCVSEGHLFIVRSQILRTYFNRKKQIYINKKTPFFFKTSAIGNTIPALENKPDFIIAFFKYQGPKAKKYYAPAATPGVFWFADSGDFVTAGSADIFGIEKIFKTYK